MDFVAADFDNPNGNQTAPDAENIQSTCDWEQRTKQAQTDCVNGPVESLRVSAAQNCDNRASDNAP
jgi:hypothetical protein